MDASMGFPYVGQGLPPSSSAKPSSWNSIDVSLATELRPLMRDRPVIVTSHLVIRRMADRSIRLAKRRWFAAWQLALAALANSAGAGQQAPPGVGVAVRAWLMRWCEAH
jgi:hypothetical protein